MRRPRPAFPPALRLLAGGGLVLCLGAATARDARADGDAPDSRRTLLQAAGPAPSSPDTSWSDLEELFVRGPALDSGLSDGATLPDAHPEAVLEQTGAISCGTPILRAAERAMARTNGERRAALSLLTSAPRFAAEQSYAVAGEPLVIRWDANPSSRHALLGRDADGDRIPDVVQSAADEARGLLHVIADAVGWDRRPAAGAFEIRLASTPFAEGSLVDSSGTSILVVSREERGPERLSALSHQLAHAIVREVAPDLPPSFDEALATWLGESAFADQLGIHLTAAQLLPAHHPSRTLLSAGIGAARGDATFLRWADETLDLSDAWMADVLAAYPRQLDEARRSGRLSAVEIPQAAIAESLDEVLAHHGSSLADAVAEHQAWALEQDLLQRDQSTSVDEELDRLPEDVTVGNDEVAAFGQVRYGVQPPASGGLSLALDPAEPLRAIAVASLADGTIRRFDLGAGPVTLPGASIRRVVVLVQSPEIPRRWSRWGSHDPLPAETARLIARENADWPFAMDSIGAETLPGQVTLSWDTSSEEDLAGWLVERAVRPSGPWSPLSNVPLPAQAIPGKPASYSFVDATARPSQRYHYRVRALTTSGLAEPSASTSVRTLPRAR